MIHCKHVSENVPGRLNNLWDIFHEKSDITSKYVFFKLESKFDLLPNVFQVSDGQGYIIFLDRKSFKI